MNRQISHIFGLVIVLFAVLVGASTWWSVVRAEELTNDTTNQRPLLEEQRIPRGLITATDGTRLAESRPEGSGASRRFVRTYPEGSVFSHAIGYSFVDRGRSGLEKSRNDELTGQENEFTSIVDELSGTALEGDDIRLTLDPAAQRSAIAALGGQTGSIVAIEPATGRIRAMVSQPDFDPNEIPTRFAELNRAEGSPIFNRATQARYPPGSTMKVVTAAAAIDSGKFTPESLVDGTSGQEIGGLPLSNFGAQDFGPTTLTDALTNSVNTVWAQVGEQIGTRTYFDYMDRFGFSEDPPVDYPAEQLTPSGVFEGNKLLKGGDAVDVGRVAIGQERLQVTPLQMAMVAAAVANKGTLMEPQFVERVTSRDGRVRERVEPDEYERVMKESTAAAVTAMMSRVVEEGSGTAAALSGIPVAGKTGTAEVDGGASNQAWFIAFAPVKDPKIAIAVTVERTQSTGGLVAAPIAKTVLQELLSGG